MKKMISRRNFLKAAGVSAAALGLAACGGSSSSSTAASTATSTAASSTAAASGASGKVYYLNFKPEQDQDWQDLAAEYTKETGVPVTVVTAASGQYETTLMSEMEKSEAPTLFQVNGPVGLANWKDYCYDLSGSKLYGELTSDSFALKDGDAVTSICLLYTSLRVFTECSCFCLYYLLFSGSGLFAGGAAGLCGGGLLCRSLGSGSSGLDRLRLHLFGRRHPGDSGLPVLVCHL